MSGYVDISISQTSHGNQTASYHLEAQSKAVIELALDHNLQQLVTKPTRGENILDVLFTKNESLVQHVNVKPV